MAYQLNTCSPVTLSSLASNLFTCPLVHSSTKHLFICYFVFSRKQLVNLSTCSVVYLLTKYLFTCYFVFSHKQLVYSSTCSLVYLLTCSLVYSSTCSLVYLLTCSLVYSSILSTFFKYVESERWSFGFLKMPFWLAKGAL